LGVDPAEWYFHLRLLFRSFQNSWTRSNFSYQGLLTGLCARVEFEIRVIIYLSEPNVGVRGTLRLCLLFLLFLFVNLEEIFPLDCLLIFLFGLQIVCIYLGLDVVFVVDNVPFHRYYFRFADPVAGLFELADRVLNCVTLITVVLRVFIGVNCRLCLFS
jgi:hypothetical protein